MCRSPSMVGSSAFLRVSATDTRGVHWNFFTVAIVALVSSLLDSNNGEQGSGCCGNQTEACAVAARVRGFSILLPERWSLL